MKALARIFTCAATMAAVALAAPLPAEAAGNPYTPYDACGSGFSIIDQADLSWGGTVYLLYNSRTGENCAATIKSQYVGTPTWTGAALRLDAPSDDAYADNWDYKYYAAVKVFARGHCVQWSGYMDVPDLGLHGIYRSDLRTHCGS